MASCLSIAWLSVAEVSSGQTVPILETRVVRALPDDDKNTVKDITFDSLKFDMEVGDAFSREMLTSDIEELFERTVRIKGFIRPSFRQSGLTKFVFVRDDQECCFGPGAALYDCILVELAEGKTTDFTVRPITIRGEIYFQDFTGPDGNTWAIYRMRHAVVE
ncbi:MAG TPA: hypothetical protein PKD54_01215 [Pirellulaceae bacterium]|nr:hypothetical protein [Pirellulaceae bacterium]